MRWFAFFSLAHECYKCSEMFKNTDHREQGIFKLQGGTNSTTEKNTMITVTCNLIPILNPTKGWYNIVLVSLNRVVSICSVYVYKGQLNGKFSYRYFVANALHHNMITIRLISSSVVARKANGNTVLRLLTKLNTRNKEAIT